MAVHARTDRAWLAAWVFLVLVVVCGFLIQARTISDLHDTQDLLDLAIQTEVTQTHNGAIRLCQLLLDTTPSVHHAAIREAFRKQEVDCKAPLLPPAGDG